MTAEKSAKLFVKASRLKGMDAVKKATRLLVDAHRSRQPAETREVALKSEKDAYRVQEAVFAQLWPGAKPAAWKAGGPSDKVEPTAAPIPPENFLLSPASVTAASMHMIGVEAEVAYRMAQDLPPRAKPYSEKEVAAAVGEVLVTIELCATRLADWKASSGLWKLTDFQQNGALVAGSGTRDWQKIDFLKQEVEFRIGAKVRNAKGAHPYGNPFRLLPWLVAHACRHGMGLRAGDVVTTGAWTGLESAKAGDEVVARFPGIGEAALQIL
ncbi:MAG TPA: fumarylacetoacetate hydrolase family protein [Burkholderiales bacterium]|nr:fumarylacetoacetate hydrolase family protein [Burkholderiales bacterium]